MKSYTINYEIVDTLTKASLTTPRPLLRVASTKAAIYQVRQLLNKGRAQYGDRLISTYRDYEAGEVGMVFDTGFTQRYFIQQEGK